MIENQVFLTATTYTRDDFKEHVYIINKLKKELCKELLTNRR